MTIEGWKEIPSWYISGVTGYWASTEGRIRRPSGIIHIGKTYNGRYLQISIKKTYHIHRLIAQTFLPNFYGKKTVNHKDGNRLNNRLYNLEWATTNENNKHAHRTGLIDVRRRLIQTDLNGNFIREFESGTEAKNFYGYTSTAHLTEVTKGQRKTAFGSKWKYVE